MGMICVPREWGVGMICGGGGVRSVRTCDNPGKGYSYEWACTYVPLICLILRSADSISGLDFFTCAVTIESRNLHQYTYIHT